MRLRCYDCGKSVSTEVDDATVVRALLRCPECIEQKGAEMGDEFIEVKTNQGRNVFVRRDSILEIVAPTPDDMDHDFFGMLVLGREALQVSLASPFELTRVINLLGLLPNPTL